MSKDKNKAGSNNQADRNQDSTQHDDKLEESSTVQDIESSATITQLQERIKELEQQLEQQKAKKLQTMADFENYRKRMQQEKSKFGVMANKMFINSILEVLDDVRMALHDENMDVNRARSVLENLTDKMLSTLQLNGVERIEVEKGNDFDSSYMEAITTVPGEEPNKVVDVISGAFRYSNSDELLKNAKVVVSK